MGNGINKIGEACSLCTSDTGETSDIALEGIQQKLDRGDIKNITNEELLYTYYHPKKFSYIIPNVKLWVREEVRERKLLDKYKNKECDIETNNSENLRKYIMKDIILEMER